MRPARPAWLPDNFTLAILVAVVVASLLPASGRAAQAFDILTALLVALLFFLHGAKLSSEAVVAGLAHWRLHLTVLASTFVLIPALGLALQPLLQPLVGPELYLGVLFLCVLPSTVQSSIAFVSVARGNVAAAVCSASASNLLGMFITPLLAGLVLSRQGASSAISLDAAGKIAMQLLLPFVAGQVARRWIGGWVARHKALTRFSDQGTIVLVVYTAFSAAVIEGLWRDVPPRLLIGLLFIACLLLALTLLLTTWGARRLGFDKEDEITIVFCGSKKTLASGVPMAKVLFAASAVGTMVLPLMIFHQLQLMVCAVLARRYAARPQEGEAGGGVSV
jgi:sodium/bile acid cotransporter 7